MNARWVFATVLTGLLAVGIFVGGFFAGRLVAPQASNPAYDAFGWPRAVGGMMDGGGMMGGDGMMGDYGWNPATSAEPLTVDQATRAVEAYLAALDYQDLEIAEVMIFDNHAYVEVRGSSRGIGAFELLVDPLTKAVFLEYGPSMMWNTEYGMMGSRSRGVVGGMMGGYRGGMGGMMGGVGGAAQGTFDPDTLPITPEDAIQIARDYLAQYLPAQSVQEKAEVFPGYYTLHTFQDGQVMGMLSVNGYTGQVWYHTWHGQLLEVSEASE